MSQATPNDVRKVIATYVSTLSIHGSSVVSGELSDDLDLYLSGTIDSLGLLGLVETIRGAFGEHIDFEDLDPEEMTIVGPLCRFVADRANAA
ncbi:MAG: hypothetical protein ACREEB_07365 [Caulobacteraceae bacterium]